MIGSLKGIIAGIYEDRAIIEVNGVGYLVFLMANTLSRLRIGEAIHVFTETYVREDALKLYGFTSDLERSWFMRLQDVTGVGARVALAILDVLPPNQIIQAIETGDKTSMGRASGVGPKLAQRIVTELKGRQMPLTLMSGHVGSSYTPPMDNMASEELRRDSLTDMSLRNNAISALQNLGINNAEAMNAVAEAFQTFDKDPELGELVKAALKELKR